MLGSVYKGVSNGVCKSPVSILSPFFDAVQGLINSKMQQLKYVNENVAVAILRFITRLQNASETLLTYKILSYTPNDSKEESSTFSLIQDYLEKQSDDQT